MSKKKIALVSVFFAPQSIGGATRVLMDNAELLRSKYSHKYDLVAFTTNHEQQAPHSVYTYLYNDIRVYRAGVIHRVNMDWHPRDSEMKALFMDFLLFEKPDLVHFHCVQRLSASVVEAVLEMGIPYIVTIHDAWWISDHQFLMDQKGNIYPEGHNDPFAPNVLPNEVTLDQSLERRAYLKFLLNRANQVQIVSEAFAKIYHSNGIVGLKINRNGIQPRAWLPRERSIGSKIRVGHIGGMSNHKGYHLFKSALSNYPFKNLEALVVDHAAQEDAKLSEQWGTVTTRFIKKVPQSRIEELFSRIDVLVAPSIWPESFGLVTREATAAGVWVISTNMGGIGEDIIEDRTGWVINPCAIELSNMLKRLDSLSLPPKPDEAALDNIRLVSEQVRDLDIEYENILK